MQRFERRQAVASHETRDFAFEVRSVADTGQIEGYGSVFGVRDDYGDIVVPGAFAVSLARHKMAGTMPAMLRAHDCDEPIGRWDTMVEDAHGLRVSGTLTLDTVRGRETLALLKANALNGLSIGFITAPNGSSYDPTSNVRMLKEIDLWEVSIVTFPANTASRVDSVKASGLIDQIQKPSDAERWLREAAPGLSKADATAFVSRLLRFGAERREAIDQTGRLNTAAEKLLSLLS